jgi:cytochrome b6-f complex iron-sulfur subunit
MTERVDGITSTTRAPGLETGADQGTSMSRRRIVTIGSFGFLGAAGLAACGSSDTGSAGGGGSQTGSSDAPAATGSSSGSGSTSGTKLAKLADVPVGSSILLSVGDKMVILAQPTKGKPVAFSAICTHQGCTVNPGTTPTCPCHGSSFDLATGKNLSGPAPSPLPAVAVVVQDGEVVMKA